MSGLWPCGIGLSCRGLRRHTPANNALQLTRPRRSAGQGFQPSAGRVRGRGRWSASGRASYWEGRRTAER
jgi:hypothetical protein